MLTVSQGVRGQTKTHAMQIRTQQATSTPHRLSAFGQHPHMLQINDMLTQTKRYAMELAVSQVEWTKQTLSNDQNMTQNSKSPTKGSTSTPQLRHAVEHHPYVQLAL